jgi:hypothetical protein
LVDRLDKVARQLRVELAARRKADVELEALRALTARVWDLVLGGADRRSSLAASFSMMAELLEDKIDAASANGACWGSHSMLVVVVLHLSELRTDLEVHRSRGNMDLTEDDADALRT